MAFLSSSSNPEARSSGSTDPQFPEFKTPVLATLFYAIALLNLVGAVVAGLSLEYGMLFSLAGAGVFLVGLGQVITYIARIAHNSQILVELRLAERRNVSR